MDKILLIRTRHVRIELLTMLLAALFGVNISLSASVPVTSDLILHFDAGSIDNLNDGESVNVWPDISGQNNNAVVGGDANASPVYKQDVLNDNPVVRFTADNCYFTFNDISNIRTVFWVCKEDPAATGNRFLLGHSDYWDFHRGWYNIWDSTWTSSYILNGITRLDGTVVSGTSTSIPNDRFSIISLKTTWNVRANQLSRDRDNTAAGWHGDIAEIIIYSRALSDSEIADVEGYLNQKYFPESEPLFHEVSSPDGKLTALLLVNSDSHLAYSLQINGVVVLEESLLGISIDGFDIGQSISVDWEQEPQEISNVYPWRGLKSEVLNHYITVSFPVTHIQTGFIWNLEVRVYNDGFAYRYIIPVSGTHTINGESSQWVLPYNSEIWYQTETSHYEGYYHKSPPSFIDAGTPIGFPVVAELNGNSGYLFISEGALSNYSGMTLRTTGTNKLVSTFENRTYHDSEMTDSNFNISGSFTTPWRITGVLDNLNELVNCDLVHNVCPPADPDIYPDGINSDWIIPGRATWGWWHDADPADFDLQKDYIDEAALLDCRYYVADGGWWGWAGNGHDEYYYLKQLCDYASQKNVGIFVWAWLGSYQSQYQRASFFSKLKNAGAAGVKFDFNNSESLESVQLYEDTLRDAAKYELMINYHGMIKPTGKQRTFPNEITREGVIGLEWNRWDNIPPSHYATIPFTRLVAGHGDTTPCTLDPASLRGATYAFQIASAVVHHSPLLHWAEQPDMLLSSKAVNLIRKIESCWDETFVLSGSQIGSLAAMAKRKGNEWFVGILNGNADSSVQYNLDLSFLEPGYYYAQIVRDDTSNAPGMVVRNVVVSAGQQLAISLAKGGGYVANFSKLALSPLGGWFVGAQQVSIDSFYSDSEIHYTLDGSEPDISSPLYVNPINIDISCLIRAKVIAGEGISHDVKGWFYIIPPIPSLPDVYLSDLNWISASVDSNIPRKDRSIEGNILKVAGHSYQRGIGVHADSEIVYDLLPEYTRFVSTVGIDDEIVLNKASVVFSVEIDGQVFAQSPLIRHDGETQFWNFNVYIPVGSQKLKIKSWSTYDGSSYDHADWVNSGFVCGSDMDDLLAISQIWLNEDCVNSPTCLDYDFNSDSNIDLLDFSIIAKDWISR